MKKHYIDKRVFVNGKKSNISNDNKLEFNSFVETIVSEYLIDNQIQFDYTDTNGLQHRFGINQFDVSALAGVPYIFDGTGSYIYSDSTNYAVSSLYNNGLAFSPILQTTMKSTGYESTTEVELDGFTATSADLLNGTNSSLNIQPGNFGIVYQDNISDDIYQLYCSGTNIYLTGYNQVNGLTTTILCDTDEIGLTISDTASNVSATVTQDVLLGIPKHTVEVNDAAANKWSKLENYSTYIAHFWKDGGAAAESGMYADNTGASIYATPAGSLISAIVSVVPDLGDTFPGINISPVREFADNVAALAAGLTAGAVYRTGDVLKIVH